MCTKQAIIDEDHTLHSLLPGEIPDKAFIKVNMREIYFVTFLSWSLGAVVIFGLFCAETARNTRNTGKMAEETLSLRIVCSAKRAGGVVQRMNILCCVTPRIMWFLFGFIFIVPSNYLGMICQIIYYNNHYLITLVSIAILHKTEAIFLRILRQHNCEWSVFPY